MLLTTTFACSAARRATATLWATSTREPGSNPQSRAPRSSCTSRRTARASFLKLTGGRFFVNLPIQPIGVDDVAVRLAELATGAPASTSGKGRVADIGGPEILQGRDILTRLQQAGRAKKQVFSLSLPGKTFAAFRAGHHLTGLPGYGTQTFDEWLASGALK